MIKLWSELRVARSKELIADVATLVWVVFWGNLVWQLFQFLSSFAEAGRAVRSGGETMVQSGRDLGESLAGLPLVGSQARDIARDAFAGAGRPLSDFGIQLEQFIFVVALVLALAPVPGARDPRPPFARSRRGGRRNPAPRPPPIRPTPPTTAAAAQPPPMRGRWGRFAPSATSLPPSSPR